MAMIEEHTLADLGALLAKLDDAAMDSAVRAIAAAKHVTDYAGGREGLAVRGFAMRVFRLGRSVSVVGDMTIPPIGAGAPIPNVRGPGEMATASALVGVAKAAGAKVRVITPG